MTANNTEKLKNKPANAAPVEMVSPAPTEQAPADNAENGEKKRGRGAIPTMPICAVYERPDGKTIAAVVAPTGERYEASGRGKGSAMGSLVDMGFVLSGLHLDPPAWVTNNKVVPDNCKVIGFANISGFPLPKQD